MSLVQRALRLVLLAVVSAAVPVAIAEIALRFAGYDPLAQLGRTPAAPGVLFRESEVPDLVYDLEPGARLVHSDREVAINSHGFRGAEVPLAKPLGHRRILVLGDSIAFGKAMPARDTFAAQLELALVRDGQRAEVLNLAVSGYDTLQQVVRLEHLGVAFDPDEVVLAYCLNDLGATTVSLDYVRRLKYYRSPIYRLRALQWIAIRIDRISEARYQEAAYDDTRFAELNRGRIADVSGDAELTALIQRLGDEIAGREPQKLHRFLGWHSSRERIGKLRYSLERLASVRRAGHFGVTVVVVPFLREEERSSAYRIAYEIVLHEARRQGFDVVDVRDAFVAAGMDRLREGRDPIHPNARGHAIIAQQLRAHFGARRAG
jgi:lysophospholipase L1-like esterase